MICTGRGDRGGGHCCYIGGKVCQFLTFDGDLPRCGLLLELGSWERVHTDKRYLAAPVAQFYVDRYPGFGCGDWPQNIPEALADPDSSCCWRS